MSDYAEPIEKLIDEFRKLPGIGAKSAQRLAYSILRRSREDAERLSQRDPGCEGKNPILFPLQQFFGPGPLPLLQQRCALQ